MPGCEGAAVRRSGPEVRMSAFIAPFVLVALLSGCSRSDEESALQPVALPDVSSAADSVQKQIRDRYQSLQSAIDR